MRLDIIAEPRVRRARVGDFTAELDLATRAIVVHRRPAHAKGERVGVGVWDPLPEPMGDLRGRVIADCMHRRVRTRFEYLLARGNRGWSYMHGPWISARELALTAGAGDEAAEMLRRVMWLFYRNLWSMRLSAGCGWGADSFAPMIAAALRDPAQARARWELLILTGGLRWPVGEGDLEELDGDALHDDFYATP